MRSGAFLHNIGYIEKTQSLVEVFGSAETLCRQGRYLRCDWLVLGEHFPEAESLIASSCHDRVTLRVHGEVEYSEVMSGQRRLLFHRRVTPDDD